MSKFCIVGAAQFGNVCALVFPRCPALRTAEGLSILFTFDRLTDMLSLISFSHSLLFKNNVSFSNIKVLVMGANLR